MVAADSMLTLLALASKASVDAVSATISEMEALAAKALKSGDMIMGSEMMAMMATASEVMISVTFKWVSTDRKTKVETTNLDLVPLASADRVPTAALDKVATVEAPVALAPEPTLVQSVTSNTRRVTLMSLVAVSKLVIAMLATAISPTSGSRRATLITLAAVLSLVIAILATATSLTSNTRRHRSTTWLLMSVALASAVLVTA